MQRIRRSTSSELLLTAAKMDNLRNKTVIQIIEIIYHWWNKKKIWKIENVWSCYTRPARSSWRIIYTQIQTIDSIPIGNTQQYNTNNKHAWREHSTIPFIGKSKQIVVLSIVWQKHSAMKDQYIHQTYNENIDFPAK